MKIQYQIINSLHSITEQYDTYLVDVGGVICDGKNPFNKAITVINELIKQKKQIVFLSNNPRPSTYLEKQLKTFGIADQYRIVTSGDFLHYTLNTNLKNKKIYHLGRNRQHALLEGIDIQLVSNPHDADAIILSCFVEGNENHTLYDIDLEKIRASEKPVYCPNPDQLALEGTIMRYPSGYFAHKLTQMGRPVTYLGKPYQALYDFITHMHPDIYFDKKTTIMIGDTLETDVLGAMNFGIDSLLLLSGITGLFMKEDSSILDTSSYQPTYVMKTLQ
jgi:HAD superfamily hydrolase (TIGR01459 family)